MADTGIFFGRRVLFTTILLGLMTLATFPQAINQTGNGGKHTVQGRIYDPSGKRSDLMNVKVLLQSFGNGDLWVYADSNGSFVFKNLKPGSYAVMIDGSDQFDEFVERIMIDDPGASSMSGSLRMGSAPKIFNVQVYLRPRRDISRVLKPSGVLDARLSNVPAKAAEHYKRAQFSIGRNELDEAMAELRQAIGIHPSFALASNDLGVLLEKRGESKPAIDAFRSAVKHDPEFVPALLNLGSALAQEGEYAAAERYLAIALSKNADSFRGHYYMGITQTKLGRLDIAEQAFLQAIKIGGDQTSRAHYLLGGVYWAAKNYRRAADELEKYLSMEPKAADAAKTRESIAELRKKS